MRIWPVLLDSAPSYLGLSATRSLLSVPLGRLPLAAHLRASVAKVTPNAPIVVAPAGVGQAYADMMAVMCPGVRVVFSHHDLLECLAGYEISDVLLVVDPRCLPAQDSELRLLTQHFSGEQQVAHHLVAFESGIAGTKEQVNLDASGFVRNIHRFYEPATWPFLSGVAASLVPLSSGVFAKGPLPESVTELRRLLMARGVSSRDVAITRGAFDLTGEQGLLAASEQHVLSAAAGTNMLLVGEGQRIDATARIIGPVVVHEDVVIGEHVTVVGPALIGAGAHLEAGAVVAHTLVGPGCTITRHAVARDRVWFHDCDKANSEAAGPALSFNDRLTRLSYDAQDRDIEAEADRLPRLQVQAKRIVDVIVAAFALVVLSPVLGALAALVRLESEGPIFYGGEREGVDGHVFKCWKFRTMRTDAHAVQHQLKGIDKMDGPHFKLDRDPRVTRIGRFLRAANLDELPQLFNVLRGDMSLVGPRPSPFRENQICVPWREARLSVRPGITGLWQVCRQDRSSGDFHQWIEYDLLYVQHASLMLDLKILVATVLTLGGKAAVPAPWMIRPRAVHADLWIDRHAEPRRDVARGLTPRTSTAASYQASARSA